MDATGSFLFAASIRVAVLPASQMSLTTFNHLASCITSHAILPSNALPKPQKPSSRSFLSASSSHAHTYSGLPADLRSLLNPSSSTSATSAPALPDPAPAPPSTVDHGHGTVQPSLLRSLPRSRSLTPAVEPTRRTHSLSPPRADSGGAGGGVGDMAPGGGRRRPPRHPFAAEAAAAAMGTRAKSLFEPGVDVTEPCVRLRYTTVPRDGAGELIMPPRSEWDSFTGRRIWGVVGVVDCTDSAMGRAEMEAVVREARRDFVVMLEGFTGAAVSRLIVFATEEAVREGVDFVMEVGDAGVQVEVRTNVAGGGTGSSSSFSTVNPSPTSTASAAMMSVAGVSDVASRPVSIGYVPLARVSDDTRREVRAQIVHFAGLLLSALQSWMEMESVGTDLFVSPLDERNPADKQSQLAKRRQGRLDKLHGDYFLLTGSPSNALGKFNTAVEKAKANGDSLWLAGAMEGSAAAQVYTHVSAGGKVDDAALVSRIIEQYGQVYKLYQKKSVTELEAGAAMRLAEFLGRWTLRRKDALEALEHAARVGEGLRAPKRQSLWEALAHFSQAMGWRRKAALFLYRLGSLSAGQDMWGTAVTWMTASAKQFGDESVPGSNRKVCGTDRSVHSGAWPDLHRQMLLEAAHAGHMAGMVVEAAGHLVHALSLSPAVSQIGEESDSAIVDMLLSSGGKVPAWIPHAHQLVEIVTLSAVQIASLSVVERQTGDGAAVDGDDSADFHGEKDPFLYNPFAARAAAMEKAEASRAVTWVCGELAHVELSVQNRLRSRLSVEVIAVSIAEEDREEIVWPMDLQSLYSSTGVERLDAGLNAHVCNLQAKQVDSVGSESAAAVSGFESEPGSMRADCRTKTQKIRSTLRAMSKVATTISQNVNLSPSTEGPSTFNLSVIPRRTGAMRVCGVVLRLFSGAIIMLPTPEIRKGGVLAPPILVMAPLPKLDVSIQTDPCASTELSLLPSRLKLFEGEHTRAHVWITNSGSDDIAGAVIRTVTERPEALRVSSAVGNSNLQTALSCLRRGQSKRFEIQLYAVRPERIAETLSDSAPDMGPRYSNGVSVSVEVKYTGQKRNSHFRMTKATLTAHLSPAIDVERLSHFRFFLDGARAKAASGESRDARALIDSKVDTKVRLIETPSASLLGIVIDVGTRAPVPVQVSVVSTDVNGHVVPEDKNQAVHRCLESYKSCLVEGGACARLLSPLIAPNFQAGSLDQSKVIAGSSNATNDVVGGFALKWAIPTLGRTGVVPLHVGELEKVVADSQISPSEARHALALSPTSASFFQSLNNGLKAAVQVLVDTRVKGSPDDREISFPKPPNTALTVIIRQFYVVHVEIKNTGRKVLPEESTVDVHVCQRDGRGGVVPVMMGVLVGAHESVMVGSLGPGDTFKHVVHLRLSSTGLFDIVARLHSNEAEMFTDPLEKFMSSIGESEERPTGAGTVVFTLDASNVQTSVPTTTSMGAQTPSSGDTTETVTSRPAASPGESPTGDSTPSQRSSLRSSLKRVGLTRGRRATHNSREKSLLSSEHQPISNATNVSPISANAVRPFAANADMPVEYSSQRNEPAIATGYVTVSAVNDTRWSSGLIRSLPTSQDPGGQSLGPLDPEPDTIVH